MASQPIFQFYTELSDYTPKIWRRIQVANNITVARLGYILMTLYEMRASHLFSIDVPTAENFKAHLRKDHSPEEIEALYSGIAFHCETQQFQVIDDEAENFQVEGEKIYDATNFKLKHALSHAGDQAVFNYDFGDGWQVALRLEDTLYDDKLPGSELPRVLEGAGFGIVEDCGGPGGLEELAKAFQKKQGDAYETLRSWLGVDDLDLTSFDLDDMNFRLKKIPRIYAQSYEKHLYPTQQSIDLIERQYLHE